MSLKADKVAEGAEKEYGLPALLDGLSYTCISGVQPGDVTISGVSADSRDVCEGTLFIALVGLNSDGHDFIGQALEKGCSAILVEQGKYSLGAGTEVCVIEVNDSHKAYAEIAAAHYEHPAREMNFVGITGTNGKTTVTYLLETIFEYLDYSVGVIGTVNYRYRDRAGEKKVFPAPFTTPEPLILQKLLREMANEGVRYVLMEVSSHALAQKRLGDVKYDIAVFTNLSRDHLDYHSNMEEYFHAKTLLFSNHLKKDGSAVIFFGDKLNSTASLWSNKLVELCKDLEIAYMKTVGYVDGDVSLVKMDAQLNGTSFTLATHQGEVGIQSSLAGKFNVGNCMAAMAVALELGFDVHDVQRGLDIAEGAPGRVQHIPAANGDLSRPFVFVDYAHTPDALEKVLETLKAIPHRDLFCVFGCGGDRDKGKRDVMGRIAGGLCDVVVITDDNPRTEASGPIIQRIVEGIKTTDLSEKNLDWYKSRAVGEKGFLIQPNREEAIELAIRMSSSNDIVVVAGKGHEQYQLTNEGKRFFNDVLESQDALVAWNIAAIEKALGVNGEIVGEEIFLKKVSTDTRSIETGDIFVALRGENFDGHNFLDGAVAAGAGVLIIDSSHVIKEPFSVPVFKVKDTLEALGDLASYRRNLLRMITKPVVVGLTGSSGKTSVKEMVASIFMEEWPDGADVPVGRVLKTQGNFNNLIGLPLSLLPLSAKHKVAVLEMGMNSPGEIERLVEIGLPDICCINNIHAAHLEGLHSIEGVAKAKEELLAGSSAESVFVVNLDDVRVRKCAEKYQQKKISFTATSEGLVYSPDVWATGVSLDQSGSARFLLHIGDERCSVKLQVPGEHNVLNGLAAASICHGAGVSLSKIAAGLCSFKAVDKRMMVVKSFSGISVLNDTYNANPASMEAGLATLEQLAIESSVAVLGDMLELGESSRGAHRELGLTVARKGVSYLAVVGEFASEIIDGATSAGMDPAFAKSFEHKQELVAWLKELREQGALTTRDWILVKASRGMRFETIVEQLLVDV